MGELFLSALILGLLGAGHCIGMCGGVASALAFAIPGVPSRRRYLLLACYNLGRIASYASIGALFGWLGHALLGDTSFPWLRLLAGLMLVLMGLYIADWWRILRKLEQLGGYVWRYIQPVTQKMLPVRKLGQALLLGALWGWLPCGLIYSALVLAGTQGGVLGGAMLMAVFGLGTLPALFLSGIAAKSLKDFLQRRCVRVFNGLLLLAFGLWTIAIAFLHSHHGSHTPSDREVHHHHHH